MRLPVLLINLDIDTGRLADMNAALAAFPGLAVQRVPAVFGRYLADLTCLQLSDSAQWSARKGELGCFLSHARAWEVAAASDAAWCLVLEDDVSLCGLQRWHALQDLDSYDFVFVNDRMSPGGRDDAANVAAACLPIRRALMKLNESGKGVGSDGYLLRPSAARALLHATARDLCFGNIDWRLLRYGVLPALLEEFAGTRVDTVIRTHHNPARPPGWGVLRAACTSTPLVRYRLGIPSRIVGDAA